MDPSAIIGAIFSWLYMFFSSIIKAFLMAFETSPIIGIILLALVAIFIFWLVNFIVQSSSSMLKATTLVVSLLLIIGIVWVLFNEFGIGGEIGQRLIELFGG